MASMPSKYVPGWAGEHAVYRTARKRYECRGDGAYAGQGEHAPDCERIIMPGMDYIEYTGECMPYARGSAHSITCALYFDYIRHVQPIDALTSSEG